MLTSLLVPAVDPRVGAEGLVRVEELWQRASARACLCVGWAIEGRHLAARGKVLALGVDALVVIDVVLPAVLGLVDVGKASVDAWKPKGLAQTPVACGND